MKKEHYGKVIILNGPPGSGKDTIQEYITTEMNGHHEWFAARVKGVLFKQAVNIAQVSDEDWFDRYNTPGLKEVGWDVLGGLSQREFLIKISEQWVKPVFGKDFYGIKAAEQTLQVVSQGVNVIFSDGGFQEEFDVMSDILGAENILLVHLHREGCDFRNDSRDYIKDHNGWIINIENDGTVKEAAESIINSFKKM